MKSLLKRRIPSLVLGLLIAGGMLFGKGIVQAAVNPDELPQVGYHPGGVNYYSAIPFANALWVDSKGWRGVRTKSGGYSWETVEEAMQPGQQDSLGNPQYLLSGQDYLRSNPGLNGNDNSVFTGRLVLTWQGAADIRIGNGMFIPNGQNTAGQPQSNGAATGLILNGTRVYQMPANPNGADVRIYAITADPSIKPKNIKLWLAHPGTGNSLIGQTFHPKFLERVNDRNWGYIRFMDWNPTNASPQKDWTDRRPPNHTFQAGVINPRDPSEGTVWYTNSQGQPVYFSGNRSTGVAFEHMVALCNATNKHMWINVPHLATDAYIANLARLIRFGADANGNPYTSTVSNPVWPPLNSGLKVYVEYSNEIWSNGASFPQGNWAEARGAALGISKAQFNARRFCQVWRIFENVFFGSADRIVKVAAVFTGSQNYTNLFLNEIRTYGPTLFPAQEPDIISPTTYFGNGIQDWAHQKAIAQAGTSDEWFYTTATFDHDNNASTPPRPVSKPIENAYWTSAAFSRHMDEAFNEWTHRQLSDSSIEGGGFDATGIGGGFGFWLRTLAQTHFSTPKPIVAYEGGPSLYTDYLDGGDVRDDGITNFIVAMNRQQRIKEVYRTHLHMAKAKGLWSHMMFVDVSTWGKYGQWGHLERYSQDPASSPKYSFIREWIDTDTNGLRHIDRPQGGVPSFATPGALADGYVGSPYSQTITTTGGNGARTVQIITRSLVPGLVATASGSGLTVSGVPTATGSSYVYALVKDSDGDPAWRTFTIRTVARSTDPAATVTFEGLANTSTSSTPEPLDVSGYRFTSFGNTGGNALQILGTAQNWASNVLFSKFWGSHHRIARADGRAFDLFELEIAAHQARSAKIIGFAPGGIRMERVVNIPLQRQPMTKVSLDWITLIKVEIQWYELANAGGANRNGAIDNIKFNTGTGIPGGGSAPASPSGLVATTASATQINLTWSDNANNETAYKVERATSSGGPWTEIAGSLAANTTSYSATGLSGSTTYHFRVRAANSSGNSGYSNTANATTSAGGGTVPVGPSGLSATTASATQINLTWSDNANNETAYKVERATSSSGPWTEIAGSLAANTTSYSATGLSGSTTYYFRVRAANSNGNSAYSNTANATTSSGGGGGGGGSISQTVSRQYWLGISGATITKLTTNANYPNNPTGSDTLTSLRAVNWANPTQTSNWADSYGQRIRGYIIAPATGSYTFWVSGDDDVELWLSTNDNPANRVRIAHITNGWTGALEWNKYASQKSTPVNLVQGQRYYVEVLHKEGGGGDSLAVGWARPAQATTTPSEVVPGSVLDAFVPAGNPPPPPSGFSAKVNFQTATAATPSGYVADSGQTYAARNGLTYGWSVDKTGRARERNAHTDKRRDTLVHFDTTGVLWEIAVPNGTYSYTIVCGDPTHNDQVNTLQIENITLTDTNGTAVGFDTYTGTVTVSDGRLTLRMASGGSNAKICYIDLAQE